MVPSIIDVWGYDREFCSSSSSARDYSLGDRSRIFSTVCSCVKIRRAYPASGFGSLDYEAPKQKCIEKMSR